MPSRATSLALAALALLAAPAGAQIPPDVRWMEFDTEHFRVHYAPGLEHLGRRLAARAEAAHRELEAALVPAPRGRIHLVVTDNTDFANGFASLFPRNRVVVFAHPPVDDPFLVYYDDWLDVVGTHELVHVYHLDHARGVLRNLREVLGRAPITFPNLLAPGWTTEGLATYLESRLTPAGRVRGTLHDMVLRTAVLEGELFTLDRATGFPTTWPAGNTQYVYGSLFMDFLARRYGHEGAGKLVRTVGRRIIPYRLNSAAREAYGVTFSQAWREWGDSLRVRYTAVADSLRAAGLTEPQQLTPAGRRTEFPRWSPDGQWIAFAQATGREEASTRLVGAEGGAVRVVAPRTTLGVTAWAPDGRSLLSAELDAVDPYRYYSDLYRATLAGGRERLTNGARLLDPDVARDGRVVATHDTAGSNVPVVVDAPGAAPRPLAAPDPDVHWAAPRWSPAGDRIAAQRKTREGHDVVVLDASGRVLRQLTRDRAVDRTPAWSPDGRWVVFSSDRTGITNLYAYDLEGDRLLQATSVLTGAF
ncbi:MAG TPA: hypothetical protein VFX98_03030, partial [Longimicrobiaceae bacterium]|nr:hypothetical protein [Longimicrobiaceae bacterium]